MTFKGESTQNLRKVARKQGMRTLFEDGMIKAIKGLTTLEEVLRITQQEMLSRGTRPEEAVSGRGRCAAPTRPGPVLRIGAQGPAACDAAPSGRSGRATCGKAWLVISKASVSCLISVGFHRDNGAVGGAAIALDPNSKAWHLDSVDTWSVGQSQAAR